jgi:hypothetical protein
VGNDRAFLGEPFDVFGLSGEVTQRNEQREIGIAVSGRPKHRIELALHVFPNSIAPRANDHATTHVRGLSQLTGPDYLLVPFGKILRTPGRNRGFRSIRGNTIRHGENELNSQPRNDQRPFSLRNFTRSGWLVFSAYEN